jgi:hypothetical protein
MAASLTAHAPQETRTEHRASDWSKERTALLGVAAASLLILVVGGEAAGRAAEAYAPRTLTLEGTLRPNGEADYGRAFEYVVAPMRTEIAASVQRIVVDARDLLPLPWGKAYA